MADTFAKYHCNYCEEDINGLRVRCIECEDFDLCLKCFACGAEIGVHKANHGYQFMDTGNFTLFPGKGQWSAREEVRLLDGIEQFGYGNWEDIAQHIETRRPEDARQKYISNYIEGSIGQASWRDAKKNLSLPHEEVIQEMGPLSPSLGSSLNLAPPTTEEVDALGYMPYRDDFEREYDNDAEVSISSLFVHPVDDDSIDVALKLAQVDMYIRRLRERARRKRIVKDYHLVQQFFKKEAEKVAQNPPKKKPKDEREALHEKLRAITQFQTAREHQNIVDSILREKELRHRIKELSRYRRNGLRYIEECREFEIARARREKRKGGASLLPTLMSQDQSQKIRENDAKSPKCFLERKSTPPDTGGGAWLSENCNEFSSWSSSTAIPGSCLPLEDPNDEPVSVLPGFHLLSSQEKKLCSMLDLKPAHYISLKAAILKEESEAKLRGTSRSLLSGQNLPPNWSNASHQVVTEFFIHAGWVSS